MTERTLDSLLKRFGDHAESSKNDGVENRTLTALTCDSREVKSGSLFIALRGASVDGHSFLADVADRGAAAVVCETGGISEKVRILLAEKSVIVIEVDNTSVCCPVIASWFYGNPAKSLRLAAVTGTNGKTTVTSLVEQLLLADGKAVGVIGTVNNRCTVNGKTLSFPAHLTTPEPIELHRLLRAMVDAGTEIVVMEVSSHALVRSRVDGLQFEAAAFTNISRDHLDYHGTMERYFNAKSLLFSKYLADDGVAVIPNPSVEGHKLAVLAESRPGVRMIRWGAAEDNDLRLINCRLHLDYTEVECRAFGKTFFFNTLLIGSYNVENLLTAWGVAAALGMVTQHIAADVSSLTGAPGRVERINVEAAWASKGPVVLVDYSHTPDALEKVLETVAVLPHRNLCVVFGCGGDRDSGKRPLMGAVAGRLADVVVLTDDNPRSELSSEIIREILPGVESAGCPVFQKDWLFTRSEKEKGCVVTASRDEAIDQAIRSMGAGDVVVIAGKGHEPYQISRRGRCYFDDRRRAENALFSWTSQLLAEATGGRVVGNAGMSGAVTTDSRMENPRGIFVALTGEHHDAHDFAPGAVEKNNLCLVVERELPLDVCQVVVADTTRALGNMAAFRRRALARFLAAQGREQNVVGVTGSCGKTTVKEMIFAILRRKWPVGEYYPETSILKTAGNFNNLIGLPLSLLPIGVDQRAVILEMGMNAPGEIARLAEIADPDISVITNVFGAHLAGLGDLNGVAAAKGELFAGTRADGLLVVNIDDEKIRAQAEKSLCRKITFSAAGSRADLYATDIRQAGRGRCNFTLHCGGAKRDIFLGAAGEHNVGNALAAATVCTALGVDLEEIALGLADFRNVGRRMELLTAPGGFTVINDCYNANPGSMAAGLKVLASFPGKKFAVIGDMLELGSSSEAAHEKIGRRAAELDIDRLAIIGEFASAVKKGALEGGMADTDVAIFADKEQFVSTIDCCCEQLKTDKDAVLVKASRGLALESIVAKFMRE
ncbi:UDP-N-acetylmuramoyl-L-alanyl-D-glutamate--2,6-diaminopimelate ligase [Desulforhopalus vacuolatus]|uniref:UDP-N-acetylmuramoyl-L-alanyl-D-glutamate--2, 6-diaminopimelate ligase n=1 Tax=Desulforhopalus vacuolatus TaxID=40414 RepID=UPI0019647107|nr:UDP-N-acetylmuramoyl-L-alanyl-D-glutamate--2,6-diaminopimelate ligase [Desulforhopalus vacuolatus]MBM9518532.1 UDP-N-acetylmuramoyl-L-alanyl-D-glutamate--2,6-diaminopimelate ligase [Desulforhopalus vacuolatus]